MQDLRIISKVFDENSNGLVICNAFLWETNSLAAANLQPSALPMMFNS